MADNLDSEFAKVVIVLVGKCLRRCHNNTLAGVNAERVKVFHVADSDTVVKPITNHLVLNFFPSLE